MTSETPERRIEDRLPRSLQNAVERIAQMSGWTAREVICAMLASGITQYATTTMDKQLLALMADANLELASDTMRRRAPEQLPPAMPEDGQTLLLTVPEAAKMLGIGKSLLWDLIYRDKMRVVRLGRRVLIPRHTLHDIATGVNQLDNKPGEEVRTM